VTVAAQDLLRHATDNSTVTTPSDHWPVTHYSKTVAPADDRG
jgi:hypothetical protein